MWAAKTGLKKVFDLDDELPKAELGFRFPDTCLSWTRKHINSVQVINNRSHTFVLQMFLPAREQGLWKFQPNTAKIPSAYKLFRLLGVAVSLVPSKKNSNIDFSTGIIGTTAEPVATCVLGRVPLRNGLREPDPVGNVILRNINPFQEWQLQLEPLTLLGKKLSEIALGVIVEFHCAAKVND